MGSRKDFTKALEGFLQTLKINKQVHLLKEAIIMKEATTKEQRKVLLDKFIRSVCLHVRKAQFQLFCLYCKRKPCTGKMVLFLIKDTI